MTDKHFHPDGFVPMQNASANQEVEGFSRMPRNYSNDPEDMLVGFAGTGLSKPETLKVTLKAMTHAEAEELIAAHQGLTFAAIRAVERFHGIS